MNRPNLKTIELQGFRSYGAEQQIAEINAPIAVFWGPNSKGKTSFAEAIEFLLTGQIVKREILASRQDEFTDALRHAHLDDNVETFVAATVQCCEKSSVSLMPITPSKVVAFQHCISMIRWLRKALYPILV